MAQQLSTRTPIFYLAETLRKKYTVPLTGHEGRLV